MPPRRSSSVSRHWAKPLGLSVTAHLAAFSVIPVLLGIAMFASSRGERSQPKAHELRFDTSLAVSKSELQEPTTPAEESIEQPILSTFEEWPLSVEPLDWDRPELDPALELAAPGQAERREDAVPAQDPEPQPPNVEPPAAAELEPVIAPQEIEAPAAVPDSLVSDPDGPEALEEAETWSPIALTEFCPEPHYPKKARRRKQQGAVVLLLTIAANGHVLHVQVVESSGHAILDRAAVKALGTWRFQPAPSAWIQGTKQIRHRILFRLPR